MNSGVNHPYQDENAYQEPTTKRRYDLYIILLFSLSLLGLYINVYIKYDESDIVKILLGVCILLVMLFMLLNFFFLLMDNHVIVSIPKILYFISIMTSILIPIIIIGLSLYILAKLLQNNIYYNLVKFAWAFVALSIGLGIILPVIYTLIFFCFQSF
jgi:hypothetical protein